jgi:hypothetical protein
VKSFFMKQVSATSRLVTLLLSSLLKNRSFRVRSEVKITVFLDGVSGWMEAEHFSETSVTMH